jgi:phosphoglucosamine mutase
MARTGTPLKTLKAGMTKCPQHLVNVRVEKNGVDVLNLASVKNAVVAVEAELGDRGRVLLRPSGTEPLVRVMVEGQDANQVKTLAQQIADAVAAAIKQAA